VTDRRVRLQICNVGNDIDDGDELKANYVVER